MITFISGAPGTGKSAALVSMLEELGKDRALYVHGIPELKIPHQVLEDPTTWHEVVPDGSIIVVDEAQNFLRPAGPGQKVPEYIAKHETHRHRGLDIYYISQGPNLIHANVRALIGRHVHLRDLGVLGRWWYEWPECADNCRTAWKNAPIKKRYRLPKRVFDKYKSSSLHVKPVRSFPWMLVVFLVAILALGLLVWRVYSIITSKQGPTTPAVPAVVAPASNFPTTGAPSAPPPEARPLSASGKPLIDDRIDWMPRISSKPETAPAFDHLREVKAMPLVAGGACFRGRCTCYTQQGTPVILPDTDCRAWIASPPFNPYQDPKPVQAVQTAAVLAGPSEQPSHSGPSVTVIPNTWDKDRIARSFSGSASSAASSERGK